MTGAMTDCTKYLNGRGFGARYDGSYQKGEETSTYIGSCEGKVTGSVDTLSPQDKAELTKLASAQIVAYERGAGWFWWCWTTESSPHWDFKALAAAKIIPQPLDSADQAICGGERDYRSEADTADSGSGGNQTTDATQETTDAGQGTTDAGQGTTDAGQGTTDAGQETTDGSQGTTDGSQGAGTTTGGTKAKKGKNGKKGKRCLKKRNAKV